MKMRKILIQHSTMYKKDGMELSLPTYEEKWILDEFRNSLVGVSGYIVTHETKEFLRRVEVTKVEEQE